MINFVGPIPKSITLRLSANEAAALAVCRSQLEATHERRFSIKAVLANLLVEHAREHASKKWQLPTASSLVPIATRGHAERLFLIITADLAEVFKTLKVRSDGKKIEYGEADIIRTLILRQAGQSIRNGSFTDPKPDI